VRFSSNMYLMLHGKRETPSMNPFCRVRPILSCAGIFKSVIYKNEEQNHEKSVRSDPGRVSSESLSGPTEQQKEISFSDVGFFKASRGVNKTVSLVGLHL